MNIIPLNKTFTALADPTRRAILARLTHGSATVNELAAPFDMSLPAVSKHLKMLERAGLLTRQKVGRYQHCTLNVEPLKEVAVWMSLYEQFWNEQLDALADFIEEK